MERYDGTEYLSGFISSKMKLKGGKWILAFAGAIIAVLLFRTFVFGSFLIPSSGMENALYQGDHILVNKWNEDKNQIDRNKDDIMQYILLVGEAGNIEAIDRSKYSVLTINNSGIRTA